MVQIIVQFIVCYLMQGGDLMRQKKSIIDAIAEMLNLNYLSDMRYEIYRPKVYSCIKKINRNKYSMEEWANLYQYISSNTLAEDEICNAYDRLLRYLRK